MPAVNLLRIIHFDDDDDVGMTYGILLANSILENQKSNMRKEILCLACRYATALMENSEAFESQRTVERRFEAMLEIVKSLHSDLGINSLIFTLSNRSHTLVGAERCSVFLYDKEHEELTSLQGEIDVKFPADKGISGECCRKNITINIADAYEDERFNQDIDKKTNYRTKSILSLPINDAKNDVIGALQLINKENGEAFSQKDVDMMQYFLKIAGPLLSQSQLYHQQTRRRSTLQKTEFEGIGMEQLMHRRSSRDLVTVPPAVLEARDEEEKEE